MKIQYISDIHLEFGCIPSIWNEITRCDSDVIVVAGDFCGHKEVFKDLLSLYEDINKPIIFVPGNHEYYGTSRKSLDSLFKEFTDIYPDIHILIEKPLYISGVYFFGTTGWWDGSGGPITDSCKRGLNDFRYIYDLLNEENEDGIKWGQKAYQFLKSSLEFYGKDDAKRVVVTHHMPSKQCIAPEYYGSPINACFANDWSHLIEETQPDLWVSGHTHTSYDFNIGKTRLVCNPQGYPSISQRMVNGQLEETWSIENPKFNPQLVIEI